MKKNLQYLLCSLFLLVCSPALFAAGEFDGPDGIKYRFRTDVPTELEVADGTGATRSDVTIMFPPRWRISVAVVPGLAAI